MKTNKVPEKTATIEQLYEIMPHMQAGRVTRSDIQKLIETATRRELKQMRDDCIEKALVQVEAIKPPEFVQEKIAQGGNLAGHEHYIETVAYQQVRILSSLRAVTGESRFLELAVLPLYIAGSHLHPYEEAMIRLRIAEVTESCDEYKIITDLALRGPEGFAKRVTILCDLALISGQTEYLNMAKSEKGKLTSQSHIDEAEKAIEYLEHRKSCSEPSKIVLARDDVLFPKFTSYLLQNSEAGGHVDWEKTIHLICDKQSLDQEYAQCMQEEYDPVKRKIRLFRLVIAHAVCGNTHLSRSIMNNHGFECDDRDRMENLFAKTMSKNRRLAGSFMAAVNITDPYLKADAFVVVAREIGERLKQ